jgi:hypothetical protein
LFSTEIPSSLYLNSSESCGEIPFIVDHAPAKHGRGLS